MKNCLGCGKFFQRKTFLSSFRSGKNVGKYCSRKCFQKNKKGSFKGKNNPMYGKFAKESANWKGGRRLDRMGYVLIYKPEHPLARQKYIMEHRLIMEKYLKRYLKSSERVHHINGDRKDNCLENLMLFANHSEHLKHHRMKSHKLFSIIIFFFLYIIACPAFAQQTASYYSEESCKREGTSGIMANGEVFDDNKLTCASWDYSFGTKLRIINRFNGHTTVVEVTDRGPFKGIQSAGYRKKGIPTLDLSKAAFSAIAPLKSGLVEVQVEVIERSGE